MYIFFSVARLKSTKLGIKLVGGKGQNFIHGDPGIFVSRVRAGSLADGRLYPGDRIVTVCIIALFQLSRKPPDTVSSRLADTPIIRTAAKFQAKVLKRIASV